MRHSSVQIRGGAPDYQNYLCSCNNVNANKRLENHTVVAGGEVPAQYLEMAAELFDWQASGGAFGAGQKTAVRDMNTIYRARLQ